MKYIYLLKERDSDWFKIGTTKDPLGRMKAYATHNPHGLYVVDYKEHASYKTEHKYRDRLKEKSIEQYHNEWFRFDAATTEQLLEKGIKYLNKRQP